MKLPSKAVGMVLACTALLVSCGSQPPTPTQQPPRASLPRFGHVVLVVGENHGFSATVGAAMPYLTSLYQTYGLSTNFYSDTHPSIGNYFTLATGQILTNDDNLTPLSFPVGVDNIARETERAGKTWKDYVENLDSSCGGLTSGSYLGRHDPLAYMSDINQSNRVCMSEFSNDVAGGTLPNFSWLVPNSCDDAHNCDPSTFDNWLQTELSLFIASPTFQKDGLLVVVFDENGSDLTCGTTTGTGCGGQVEAVLASPFIISPGYQQHQTDPRNFNGSYEHEDLLRLMTEGLGLPAHPGAAATASNMSEFFKANKAN